MKNNVELAVELTCAALNAMAIMRPSQSIKPLSGQDINNILNECYSAVCTLDKRDRDSNIYE